MAFERDGLVFVFNFHPFNSYTDYGIDMLPGTYDLVLNTDDPQFGGFGLVQSDQTYESIAFNDGKSDRNQIKLYLPARTGFVLARQ
jgi:1,4-alpha-glucan branching enzyme